MPEATLKAFADHGEVGAVMPTDGGDCEQVLAEFAKAGIDIDALAAQLQTEGAKSFVDSWNELDGGDRVQERRPEGDDACMNVLAVDVGGTNVKILATGQTEPRKFPSGPETDGRSRW